MKRQLNIPTWYVVKTRPRAEKKAATGLNELGIENYLPLQREYRQWHDRKRWVETPMFPSYVFVHTEEKHRSRVFQVPGILQYIFIGHRIAVLPDREIAQLKERISPEANAPKETLHQGDHIKITSGILSGQRGQVSREPGNNYIYITIADLESMMELKVARRDVRRV